MKIPPIDSEDGRGAWAFIAIWGGCITFTAFAAVGLYLVRESAGLSFWLALAAHAQVLVGMTALGWAMGRRVKFEASRDGVSVDDSAIHEGDSVKLEKD